MNVRELESLTLGVRHPDTVEYVECLPIARVGVATGAYTGF